MPTRKAYAVSLVSDIHYGRWYFIVLKPSTGYFSIFLFGLDAGKLIFSQTLAKTRIIKLVGNKEQVISGYGNLVRVLGFWFAAYYACFTLFMSIIDGEDGQQVSRRLANLPYILWVVAFNFGFILIFVMVDIGFSSSRLATVPKLFEALNINGLFIFLVVGCVVRQEN